MRTLLFGEYMNKHLLLMLGWTTLLGVDSPPPRSHTRRILVLAQAVPAPLWTGIAFSTPVCPHKASR